MMDLATRPYGQLLVRAAFRVDGGTPTSAVSFPVPEEALYPDGLALPVTPEALAAAPDSQLAPWPGLYRYLGLMSSLVDLDVQAITATEVPNPAYRQDETLPGIAPPPATITVTWETP